MIQVNVKEGVVARRLDPSPASARAEQLARLVYELLDAHADTDQLVRGESTELMWRAHLSYLRDLQRIGREILADPCPSSWKVSAGQRVYGTAAHQLQRRFAN